MKVFVMTGQQSCEGKTQSASVFLNGKPINQVLTPQDTPEVVKVIGKNGIEGVWISAVYILSATHKVNFVAKSSGQDDVDVSFNTADCESIDIDGHVFHGKICGWIQTFI